MCRCELCDFLDLQSINTDRDMLMRMVEAIMRDHIDIVQEFLEKEEAKN